MGSRSGSTHVVYRRTQAGDRKLAQLLACEPVRPPGEGEQPHASSLLPTRSPKYGEFGLRTPLLPHIPHTYAPGRTCGAGRCFEGSWRHGAAEQGREAARAPFQVHDEFAKVRRNWFPADAAYELAYREAKAREACLEPEAFAVDPGPFMARADRQWGCVAGKGCGMAVLRVGRYTYCRKHARKLVLSLENALAFAEGEG